MRTTHIVASVAFISAAIMASLFFYRGLKPSPAPLLASNEGFVFPVAREIKTVELTTAANQSFKLANFYQHWTLLFFGFTHCADVCPTTLTLLNRTYSALKPTYPNLQVVLVSLDPERDNVLALATYVHTFNPEFIGATGSLPNLRKLQSQLGVFSTKTIQAANGAYQIQHTASVLLINPQGKWAGAFNANLTPEQFIKAFKKSVQIN